MPAGARKKVPAGIIYGKIKKDVLKFFHCLRGKGRIFLDGKGIVHRVEQNWLLAACQRRVGRDS